MSLQVSRSAPNLMLLASPAPQPPERQGASEGLDYGLGRRAIIDGVARSVRLFGTEALAVTSKADITLAVKAQVRRVFAGGNVTLTDSSANTIRAKGSIHAKKCTVNELDSNDTIHLAESTATVVIATNGVVAQDSTITALHTHGRALLHNIKGLDGGVKVGKELFLSNSIVEAEIRAGGAATLVASKVSKITILNSLQKMVPGTEAAWASFEPEVYLKNDSVVENIIFDGLKGVVYLGGGSQVRGEVTNGKIIGPTPSVPKQVTEKKSTPPQPAPSSEPKVELLELEEQEVEEEDLEMRPLLRQRNTGGGAKSKPGRSLFPFPW